MIATSLVLAVAWAVIAPLASPRYMLACGAISLAWGAMALAAVALQ